MSKPINRRAQKKRYQMLGWITYAAMLYLALHLSHASDVEANALLEALDHAFTTPFDVFPINWSFMARAAIVGLVAPLLVYTEYLKKRDLRPSEENGSARWTEDLRKYYRQYAETTVTWPKFLAWLIRPLDKAFRKVPILNKLYLALFNLLFRNFLSPDKTPGSKNMIFSKEIYMSMNTRKTRRNNNILVIGGSGTGKSRFVVNQLVLANTLRAQALPS